jgi:hypothetical protein
MKWLITLDSLQPITADSMALALYPDLRAP